MEGYVHELRSGRKAYAPVIARADDEFLTFGDLVELMYVRGFRQVGVGLNELRDTAAKFRHEWDEPYPLATKKFATDGRRLLLEMGGQWQRALTGQHQAFFEEIGRQLVHTGDFTKEWRPLGKERTVVLDPTRSFGKPIDDFSGTHTIVLSKAFSAEDDAEKVAWWFGTTINAVKDAAEFETPLQSDTNSNSLPKHSLRSSASSRRPRRAISGEMGDRLPF